MGTSARIGIVHADGSVVSTRLNWDGYPTNVGPILRRAFTTEAQVRALLNLGELSQLGASTDAPAGHTFNTPAAGHCVAYGRDRGEKNTAARANGNVQGFVARAADDGSEYLYLFRDGSWEGASMHHRRGEFMPLDEMIVKFTA